MRHHIFSLLLLCLAPQSMMAQATFYDDASLREARLGEERIPQTFLPCYASPAESDNDERWVQIDFGQVQRVDSVKLFPSSLGWGPSYGGFPVRFYIALSDDPTFRTYRMYQDYTVYGDFPNPGLQVVTFANRSLQGRFLRLTATQLRGKKLAMSKIMVLSGGRDIAEGCQVTESNPSADHHAEVLTRKPRPMGDLSVTDHPENVNPVSQWKPVHRYLATPVTGVTLHDGLFKHVMENNIEYLLHSFTFDELVRNFRLKAGLPVKPFNKKLKWFWFKELPGSEAGRFLMGAGNTLRWMENAELRKEMNDIIDVIDQCKEPDGYIMAFPKQDLLVGERGGYTRSWVTHGLIEAGYAGNQKAFPLLRGFYDWMDHAPYLPEMMRRGFQGMQGMIPFTRTYFSPVGKPDEIQVAQRYYQENYWLDSLAAERPEAVWRYPYDRPHNYLVTTLEAYMDLYLATGAEKYLKAMTGAWNLYYNNWRHVGGSLAINEGWFLYEPNSHWLHKETGELCGNVFWAKFNQRFHWIYPNVEKYVGEIEKSIYNVILSNQWKNIGIRYFAVLDGKKNFREGEGEGCMNTCCEGQGTRAYGMLPEFIYSTAKDGVYVDLYAGSDFQCQVGGETLQLSTETSFPYGNQVSISIRQAPQKAMRLCLRVPAWAKQKMTVQVNGKSAGKGTPGTYLELRRNWKSGDKITFTLPTGFTVAEYKGLEPGFEHDHYAVLYGPVMLAAEYKADAGNAHIAVKASAKDIARKLRPIAGKPLHFTVDGDPSVEYLPYFEVGNEYFSCFPELKK